MGSLTTAEILAGAKEMIDSLRLGGDFAELKERLPGDGAHSERVAVISGYIGMMLTDSQDFGLQVAAQGLLHDIGKKVPYIASVVALDRVLEFNERAIVRRHAQEGANLISSKIRRGVSEDAQVAYGSMTVSTLRHHSPIEYLAGNSGRGPVHLASAIIGIVDTVDARYDESRIRYKKRVARPSNDINSKGRVKISKILGQGFYERTVEERSRLLQLPMGRRKLHDVIDYANTIWTSVNEEVTPEELRFLGGHVAVASVVART